MLDGRETENREIAEKKGIPQGLEILVVIFMSIAITMTITITITKLECSVSTIYNTKTIGRT